MRWILTRENFNDNDFYSYEVTEDVITIPTHKLKNFKSYIKKVNRILKKIRIPEVIVKNEERTKKLFNVRSGGNPHKTYVPVTKMIIEYPEGMTPNNNWALIAVVNHDEKVVKHVNKDYKIPEDLVNLNKSHCDRCNKTLRRHRTLIIMNKDTGEYLRAGGSCIKFYLGLNYDKFLRALDQLEELNNPSWIDGTDYNKPDYINHWDYFTFDIKQVLRVTLNWLEKNDYISKKYSSDVNPPTSQVIYNMIFNAIYYDHFHSFSDEFSSEEVIEKLKKYDKPHVLESEIYDFIKLLDPESSSYTMNLVKMFESDDPITGAQFGMLVSVVPFYKKSIGLNKEKQKINNEYVGTIGEKFPFERVKVLNIYYQEGDFGVYKKYIMEDSEGHRLVKNGTINKRYAIENLEDGEVGKGTILQFNGEIRHHNEYKGTKNTTIGRISKFKK